MPMHNLTGTTYALSNAEGLVPRRWGPGQPWDTFFPKVQARLAEYSALRSPFVVAIESGAAPREAVTRFAGDLVHLAKHLPLHESRIAARAEMHGENSVLVMSWMTTTAMGYGGFPYLPDLARRFASAWGLTTEDLDHHAVSRWVHAHLNGLYNMARYPEMGIAATMVDAQLAPIAGKLKAALSRDGLTSEQLEVFDAIAALDGPRTEMRPLILQDMAEYSAYHQFTVYRAVKATTSLWRRMWDAWLDPGKEGLTIRRLTVSA